MSQHAFIVDPNLDQNGVAFRNDVNAALQALASMNAGAADPATMFAHQLIFNQTSGTVKKRNGANDGFEPFNFHETPQAAGSPLVSAAALLAASYHYGVDSGSTDAYAITLSPAPSSYAEVRYLFFKANTANTGAATLQVGSLAALEIKKWKGGSLAALETGDIAAGQVSLVWCDGTQFILLSPLFPASPDFIFVRDEKAAGTHGGTFTAGAWQIRDLTAKVLDTTGVATLSSNKVGLPAGTWDYLFFLPANAVTYHRGRLYNVTDEAVVADSESLSAYAGVTSIVTTTILQGRFTIAATKEIRVEHYCGSTKATDGLGIAAGMTGFKEIYTFGGFRRAA